MEDVYLVEEASSEDILGKDRCGRSCVVQDVFDNIRVNVMSQGAFTMPTLPTFGMHHMSEGGCRDDLLRAKSFRFGPRTSAESKTNATTVRPNVHKPIIDQQLSLPTLLQLTTLKRVISSTSKFSSSQYTSSQEAISTVVGLSRPAAFCHLHTTSSQHKSLELEFPTHHTLPASVHSVTYEPNK